MAHHVALIVEDDPHIAAALKGLVTSLGHGAVLAATLEEVDAAVAAGGYCYVLLDMQIPATASSQEQAHVGCGETALERLRRRDPARNADGRHRLQIIVVSAYSREPEFVSRIHEMDADAFIPKPFGGPATVLDKIRGCLERAGRRDHAACDGAPAAPRAAGPVTFAIDGKTYGRRTGFLVDGARCELQDARFAVFLRMVAAHQRATGSWSSRHQLGITRSKEIPSRIRAALAPHLPPGLDVIEWDRADSFRLNPAVRVERVDWAELERHPEPAVQKVAREERARGK